MREAMLILHFLGMIMAIGPITVFLFSNMALKKLDKSQGSVFSEGLFRLNTIGHIGLTLAFISGGYLMTPYWSILGEQPFLMAKLFLYLVLLVTISMISIAARKAREKQAGASIKKALLWTRVSFLIGLAIVVLAAVVFK